jgi:hypothetical protein
VIAELHDVLSHQRDAAVTLEARLRAVELLLAAGEPRFLGLAVDEANDAAERLAALEMTRAMTLVATGVPVDVTASDLAGALPGEQAGRFTDLVDELRTVIGRVSVRREHVRRLLSLAHTEGEQRLAMAGAAQLV